MTTSTLNSAPASTQTIGLIGTILAWLRRKPTARADDGVWSGGVRGM